MNEPLLRLLSDAVLLGSVRFWDCRPCLGLPGLSSIQANLCQKLHT